MIKWVKPPCCAPFPVVSPPFSFSGCRTCSCPQMQRAYDKSSEGVSSTDLSEGLGL